MGLILPVMYFERVCPAGWVGHFVLDDQRGPHIASAEEAYACLAVASRLGLIDELGFRAAEASFLNASLADRIEDVDLVIRNATTLLNVEGVIRTRIYGPHIYVVCEAGAETLVRIAIRRLRERLPSVDDIRKFVGDGNFVPYIKSGRRPKGQTFVF